MENNYRTHPSKGFVIALTVVLLGSIGATIGIIFVNEALWFKIFIYVFTTIFIIGSSILLIDQLTHYVEIKDGYFIKHLLFKKTKVKIEDIEKIENNKKGFYEVYVNNKKLTYFLSDTEDGKNIIRYLDSQKVNIKW